MATITTIIPTIGRTGPLAELLDSIIIQSRRPDEILIADGSDSNEIENLLCRSKWDDHGLVIRHLRVQPPNAVRQRKVAIEQARGDYLFLLDDDIVLERDCLRRMAAMLDEHQELSAVTADFSNQTWSNPTRLWRWYMLLFHGIRDGEWQGRVVGPLLRFGYNPSPPAPAPMEWLGAGNSLIRRRAYEAVGGFSDFFLHRCTMNEDVDLGLKLSRFGPIVLDPGAKMAHHHAPGGRVSTELVAEDDIFNRIMVLRHSRHLPHLEAWLLTFAYAFLETSSNLVGALWRLHFDGFWQRTRGRLHGLLKSL